MNLIKALSVAALAIVASGCASIIRGTSQDFSVETEPAGATATLSTGEVCAATPCTFRRSRNERFSVTVAMDGYVTETHEITNPWSRAGTTTGIVGNALIGGGIGVGIDAATGANRDLTPNPLHVVLASDAPKPEPAAPEQVVAQEAALADSASAPTQEQGAP